MVQATTTATPARSRDGGDAFPTPSRTGLSPAGAGSGEGLTEGGGGSAPGLREVRWRGLEVGVVSAMRAVRLAGAARGALRLVGDGLEIDADGARLAEAHAALARAGLVAAPEGASAAVLRDGVRIGLALDVALAAPLGLEVAAVALTVRDDLGRHLVARRVGGAWSGALDVPFSAPLGPDAGPWEALREGARLATGVALDSFGGEARALMLRLDRRIVVGGLVEGVRRTRIAWWDHVAPAGPTPTGAGGDASRLRWADADQLAASLATSPGAWHPDGRLTMLAAVSRDARVRGTMTPDVAAEILEALRGQPEPPVREP